MIAVLAMALLLAACGSNPDKREDTNPRDLEKFDRKVDFKRQWSRGVGDGLGRFHARLQIGHSESAGVESDLAVASVDGRLLRLTQSGKRVWRVKLKEEFTAGVGVGAGIAVVANNRAEIVAFDWAGGAERWRVNVNGEVLATPQVSAGIVVVQTSDGRLMGLNAGDGSNLWTYKYDVPILTLRGTATPRIVEGILYAGLSNGKLLVLDLQTGQVMFDRALALAKGDSEIERIIDVEGTPFVDTRSVYAASFQGAAFAFDIRAGKPRWRFEVSTYLDLAAGFDNVYVVDDRSRILAISTGSGALEWESEEFLNRSLSSPVIFNGFLVIGDKKGFLHVISQVDGTVVGRSRVDSAGLRAPMLVLNKKLFVLSNEGKLASYSLGRLN